MSRGNRRLRNRIERDWNDETEFEDRCSPSTEVGAVTDFSSSCRRTVSVSGKSLGDRNDIDQPLDLHTHRAREKDFGMDLPQ